MPGVGGLLLLIVDDDPRILELAEHAARESGRFEAVVTAEHGRDALAKVFAAPRRPDLILTDLSMPQMDGFELVQTLKELSATKDIPVFMFSSSGVLYDQQRALEVGCAAFFPKPATLADLRSLMENLGQTVLDWETRGSPDTVPPREQETP